MSCHQLDESVSSNAVTVTAAIPEEDDNTPFRPIQSKKGSENDRESNLAAHKNQCIKFCLAFWLSFFRSSQISKRPAKLMGEANGEGTVNRIKAVRSRKGEAGCLRWRPVIGGI